MFSPPMSVACQHRLFNPQNNLICRRHARSIFLTDLESRRCKPGSPLHNCSWNAGKRLQKYILHLLRWFPLSVFTSALDFQTGQDGVRKRELWRRH